MKKTVVFFISFMVFVSEFFLSAVTCEINAYDTSEIENVINGIIEYTEGQNGASGSRFNSWLTGKAGSSEGDWYAIALSRYGRTDGADRYLQSLRNYIENSYRTSGGLSAAKSTEWHRIIMAVLSCGGDPYLFDAGTSGTINLVSDGVYNRGMTASLGKQGITGWIWGLIALDSMRYQIPENSFYSREDIINEILSRQLDDGGFSLAGNICDIDITASVIVALAPYCNNDENIRRAVDRALDAVSSGQLESGDFESGGMPNAESTAQVIMALTSMNIDIISDERFIKNGCNTLDGLMRYRCENGGFSHLLGSDVNDMSCVQSMMALVSLYRYSTSQSSFYDFGTYEYTEAPFQEEKPHTVVPEEIAQSSLTAKPDETPVVTEASSRTAPSSLTTSAVFSSVPEKKQTTVIVSSDTDEKNYIKMQPENSDRILPPEKLSCDRTALKIVIILFSSASAAIVFFVFRKKKKLRNNILFVIVLIAVVLLIASSLKIKSAENYYKSEIEDNISGRVTLSIDCITLLENHFDIDSELGKYIPDDGYILKSAEYDICSGDTVYDVLMKAVRENKLELSFEGSSQNSLGTVYIQSIANLGEFDFGELSGWIYTVDGQQMSTGCDRCTVSDGDEIRWAYTCDLGRDVK